MNDRLNCKGFEELTMEETMDVNGGGAITNVGSILNRVSSVLGVFAGNSLVSQGLGLSNAITSAQNTISGVQTVYKTFSFFSNLLRG